MLALLVLALPGCRRAVHADPALWAVRDADTTIYLFGTVHVLPHDLDWFGGGVKAAFERSDALVLELVLPDPKATQALIAELGTSRIGPTLPETLPDEQRRELAEGLARYDFPPDTVDHDEPWLAAMRLSTLPLRKLGYGEADGPERVLADAAAAAGKPVLGLETPRGQFGIFDTLSPAAQRMLLARAIDALPRAQAEIGATVDAWRRGDVDAIAAMETRELAGSPELAQALLLDRNRRWADWIAARMRKPGTLFVAVGAGHLAGPDSVIALLQHQGLKVERLH